MRSRFTCFQLLDGVGDLQGGLAGRVASNPAVRGQFDLGGILRGRVRRIFIRFRLEMPDPVHPDVVGKAAEVAEIAFHFKLLQKN